MTDSTHTPRDPSPVLLELDPNVVDLARELAQHPDDAHHSLARAIVDAADNPSNICADSSCDVVHPELTHDDYVDPGRAFRRVDV